MSTPNATPLKEAELRTLSTCAWCHKKLGETGSPIFFKLTLESHVLNLPAVGRQQGLGMLLGGSGRLAQVMGPDEDMTVTMDPPKTVMICQRCSVLSYPLVALLEA